MTPNRVPKPAAWWRELVALLLLVAGACGVIAVSFAWHPLVGAAVLSLGAVAGGLVLASAESSDSAEKE